MITSSHPDLKVDRKIIGIGNLYKFFGKLVKLKSITSRNNKWILTFILKGEELRVNNKVYSYNEEIDVAIPFYITENPHSKNYLTEQILLQSLAELNTDSDPSIDPSIKVQMNHELLERSVDRSIPSLMTIAKYNLSPKDLKRYHDISRSFTLKKEPLLKPVKSKSKTRQRNTSKSRSRSSSRGGNNKTKKQ
jgi:hypothetical protein